MRLKKCILFSVLCLVHAVTIASAEAQSNTIEVTESMVEKAVRKVQHDLFEWLRTAIVQRTENVEYSLRNLLLTSNMQHKTVLEKLAAHEQQVLDSIAQVTATVNNVQKSQSQLQTMLRKVYNNSGLQGSRCAVQKQPAKNAPDSPSSILTRLKNMNASLIASQADLQNELRTKNLDADELDALTLKVFPSSCDTLNVEETNTYYIRPAGTAQKPFRVLCDFEDHYNLGGGWTVFQNRFDGSVDFFQNWKTYKKGFGDAGGEHWLGLEKLHIMTSTGPHELLIEMEDYDGNRRYARYGNFSIASETNNYRLTAGEYTGTAGDSLAYHNGLMFSACNRYNGHGKENCARKFKGAWWFGQCHQSSHLNGRYYPKEDHLNLGIVWYDFHGYNYSLKSTKMMFRSRGLIGSRYIDSDENEW